jgi:hypothetical protein
MTRRRRSKWKRKTQLLRATDKGDREKITKPQIKNRMKQPYGGC